MLLFGIWIGGEMNCNNTTCTYYDETMTDHCCKGEPPDVAGCLGYHFPPVLDACCGSRMIWFDKADPRCLYVDNRRETWITDTRPGESPCIINPDTIADFTALPFPDETFACVVFDPPHFSKVGDTSRTARKYGKLPADWRDMLRRGFAECFRVLLPNGVLLFKWCEFEIPLTTVLALTDVKPLVGNKRPRTAQTHWIAFLKGRA